MSQENAEPPHTQAENRQVPAFNVPRTILVLSAVLIVIHIVTEYLLSDAMHLAVLDRFAFVPVFYAVAADQLPEPAARFWSPVTYLFLHGDWTHLIVNLVWLLAFGSAIARRWNTTRVLMLTFAGAACGALAHYLSHPLDNVPVVGASASISAYMGASLRFAFRPGMGVNAMADSPAQGLLDSLRNRSTLAFVIIWFAINALSGTGLLSPDGHDIAWEAHIGGFLLGWLGFALFDAPKNPPASASHQ